MRWQILPIAPDGTLLLKDQTRPSGCKLQGTMAIIQCNEPGMKQGNSNLVAVHPDTLEVLDSIALPEPATVPHVITMFEGRIAIYLGVNSGALRYFWDPQAKKISQDTSWVVKPMKEGQTTSDAPSILGDWIVLQTNGIGVGVHYPVPIHRQKAYAELGYAAGHHQAAHERDYPALPRGLLLPRI